MAARPNPRNPKTLEYTSRPVPLEDLELVEKVKSGDMGAYADLVRKYQDRVFNACWRICGHREDARDLTQEAFLKGLEGISGFRQQSGFYTWIFRVAVNLALSHRRKAGTHRTVSLDQDGAGGTQADGLARRVEHHGAEDPVSSAGDSELQGLVVRALQALRDDQRAIVVLRDIEGFDYHEIGEILDIPTGTVKSRLFRARMSLRRMTLASRGLAG